MLLNALPFSISLLIFPAMVIVSLDLFPWTFAPFLPIISLLDWGIGKDGRNLDPKLPESKLIWHDTILWLWCFLHPVVFVLVLWQVVHSETLANYERVIIVVVMGQVAVLSVAVGHEMLHKHSRSARYAGEVLMSMIGFPYYHTEHVCIHHKYVATPIDPVTAHRNQSYWRFVFWGIVGNHIMSWRWEIDRLRRRGLSVWHRSNPFWRWTILWIFWPVLAIWLGGWWGLLVFAVQALLGILRLRVVDYIEHYGLQRMPLPNGRFEKVQTWHSWNTDYTVSNHMLFNLQRHSDHHCHAFRPYPLLQTYDWDEAPQLPFNYLMLSFVALVPSVWFRLMNPRLDRWRRQFYPEIDDWRPYDSELFRKRPEAIGQISEIMVAAPHLGDWMNRHPFLLDSIQSRDFIQLEIPDDLGLDPETLAIARQGLVRLYYSREFGIPEMKEEVVAEELGDSQDALDIVTKWGNEKAFQLGVHTIRGNVSPVEAGPYLSNIADVSIEAVLSAGAEEFALRHGRPAGGRTAVLAFGDLGVRDLALGSDVELMVVYDVDEVHDAHDGAGGADAATLAPRTYYERLCRHFDKALQLLPRENILLASVASPAAGGEQPPRASGVTALSLAEFAEIYGAGAPIGALRSLASARVVSAEGDLGASVRKVRQEALARPRPPAALAAEAAGLRGRFGQGDECGGLPSLVRRRGGLEDVALAASFLRLLCAKDAPDIADGGIVSVFEEAGARRLIEADTASALADAARLWLNFRGSLRLVGDGDFDEEKASPNVKAVIARACGAADCDALAKTATETASRAAVQFDALLAVAADR